MNSTNILDGSLKAINEVLEQTYHFLRLRYKMSILSYLQGQNFIHSGTFKFSNKDSFHESSFLKTQLSNKGKSFMGMGSPMKNEPSMASFIGSDKNPRETSDEWLLEIYESLMIILFGTTYTDPEIYQNALLSYQDLIKTQKLNEEYLDSKFLKYFFSNKILNLSRFSF